MEDKKERRMLELRAVDNDDEKMIVEGYAIVFDSPATNGFTEIIDSHALDNCNMKDVVMRYNHLDSFMVMARTRNNSLQLQIDDKGLKIRAELIDTQTNRDLYKGIQSGLLDKMSFAFTVEEEKWDLATDTRTILKIDRLYDVAVVDTPFYDTTSIYARALNTLDNEKKKLENLKEQQRLNQRKVDLIKRIGQVKEVR